MNQKNWYAIYTKPRCEKKASLLLSEKNIENWCPTIRVKKQYTDRKKWVEQVIFSSYLFVHITPKDFEQVKSTTHVLNFVFYDKKHAIIKDVEIENMRSYLSMNVTNSEIISSSNFELNTKVLVKQGIFMDREGTIVKTHKKKVFVQISSLESYLVIEFSPSQLAVAD